MKFVETVTLNWQPYHKIEVSTDSENGSFRYIKNIRLIKPDGTPDCIKIRYFKHVNLNEDLLCEDFPVYRYFHGFKKIEYLPFALNKTGIYETIEILTESDTEFKGKIRYDIYEINEKNPKLPKKILISKYPSDDRNGLITAFIQKNYKEESNPQQDELIPENLQITVGKETHLISYTRFIRKAVNLSFYLFEIEESELYMDLSKIDPPLQENLFVFTEIDTEL